MNKKIQGKSNLAKGRYFENKVRKDLESKDWIVARWTNNVETKSKEGVEFSSESFKLVPAKQGRFRKTSTGFPDFVCFKLLKSSLGNLYAIGNTVARDVIGVECKSNGYLDSEEKAKCKWLLNNGVFSKILIAKKGDKRGEIIYKEFQ